MVLNQKDIKKITQFVKKEPRTIQDVAKHIGKTWVTADAYVQKIQQQTGLLQTKIFRAGTQGAIKLVYWNYGDAVEYDEIKKRLYELIRVGKNKFDFDPLDIYQYVRPKEKRATIDASDMTAHRRAQQDFFNYLKQTKQELLYFSGNLSWVTLKDDRTSLLQILEDLLQRGVSIRILSRVDFASIENINQLSNLMQRYPQQIEIRHVIQPLRGWISDGQGARLKDVKEAQRYRQGELKKDVNI